jgi:predicted glutamine amidotransferase/DNA-directed RNA polymerase subunit RPC12/RpoP
MCVIVLKPKNVKIPDIKILEQCFDYNNNGAGIAYVKSNENIVHIRKGFMHFKDFKKAINALNFQIGDTVMYHFRIATAGKICKENTHPFPLSKNLSDLRLLSLKTNCAIAHNGILHDMPSDVKKSDTMDFILTVLSDPVVYHNLQNKAIVSLVEKTIGHGKIALLHSTGEFTLYNRELWKEEKGILYSNYFWKYTLQKYDFDDYNYSHFASSTCTIDKNYMSRLYENKKVVECPYCYSTETQEIDKFNSNTSYWCFDCNAEFTLDPQGNITDNSPFLQGE